MIQIRGLEIPVTTATSDVSSTDGKRFVAPLTENKAIDTDRRWGPKISMGDGHTTTDAEFVDDDGEDRIQGNGVNDGGDAPHPLVNLQPMISPFILSNNNESCVTIEFS